MEDPTATETLNPELQDVEAEKARSDPPRKSIVALSISAGMLLLWIFYLIFLAVKSV